jgi:diguanylate cyclase (GGDEF)-like protein
VTDAVSPVAQVAFLAAATAALARNADLEGGLGSLLARASEAAGATRATLLVRQPDGDTPQLAASIGFAPGEDSSLIAAVLAEPDHPLATAARQGRPAFGRPGTLPDGTPVTVVDLPLIVGREGIEHVLGVASFMWPGERAIDEPTRDLLTAAAGLAALAIDRARLASLAEEHGDWLARVAGSDALTGLASRRTLDRVLELEIARAERLATELSLVVVDVDSFRATNDEAGAKAGDDLLRAVAAVLAEHVRLVDTVARIGGDEFAIVAPGSGGVAVAQRVLAAIDALPPVAGRPVSVSAGIARFPADGATAEELLTAALAALGGARTTGAGAIGEVRSS